MFAQPGLTFFRSNKARVHCPIPLFYSINIAFLSPSHLYPSSLFFTHACSLAPIRLSWRIWQPIVPCSSFDAAKFFGSRAFFTAITIIRALRYITTFVGHTAYQNLFLQSFSTLCRPPFRYPFPLERFYASPLCAAAFHLAFDLA